MNIVKTTQTHPTLIAAVALYGLRWAGAALHNHIKVAPLAAAGDEQAQAAVVERPEANLFGIPNSLYGITYYAAVLLLALSGRLEQRTWRRLARLATLAALSRSAVLLTTLWRTHTWCPICMRGHATNAALALLLFPPAVEHD